MALAALVVRDLLRTLRRAGNLSHSIHERISHRQPAKVDEGRLAQLRAALLESERQLQLREALLDTVAAALFVIDGNGAMKLVNRSARRLAGQPLSILREIAALGNTTAQLMETMQPGTRRVAYLADGQPVHVSASDFRGGGANQRLISLQRIAGELDAVEVKAWQDVAAVLTHEIMNSLTPIASLSENLELLLRDASHGSAAGIASSELTGALEAIKRRSYGLMNFVERYRAMAEVPEARAQQIDLKQFFAAMDHLVSATLRDKGVAYERRIVPEVTICADAALLEQALINLVRNAGDAAAASDRPRVTVTCELRGTELQIGVADTGHGLNEQQRDRLFVPFYTTKADGSGIGLSLTRQIALALGGRIEVCPNDPSGTIFYIVLPFLSLQQSVTATGKGHRAFKASERANS